jgi:hypothetical protein
MEALFELNLGRRALKMWMLIAEITDKFIIGLDVLRAYDVSMDLGSHMGQEEVALWNSGARPTSSRLSLDSDEVISALC